MSRKHMYPMVHTTRGYAIIINMMCRDDPKNVRKGSDVDVDSLASLFHWLKFSVEVHQDLTGAQLLKLLEQISHREQLANHDAFILVVMSHGGEGYIIAEDRKHVPINDIIKRFSMCTRLENKPKFLIVQACRGNDRDHGVTVSRDAVQETYNISCTADFLVAYATPPGYVSYRDHYKGAWFIQTLVKVFRERAHDTHAADMLTEVCRVINEEYEHKAKGDKMCPEFTSKLRYPLFLKP